MATIGQRDTIIATASAGGSSAAAVIRASGPQVFEAFQILQGRAGLSAERRCIRGAELQLPIGALPCLAVCMPGPHSYTGEDCIELIVPGHREILRAVTAAWLRAIPGVRTANPGEFTLRAFEAGRLTLEQVEGVAATIAACTDAELRAAALLRHGAIGERVGRTIEAVADMLAMVEAGIDFTDQEDVVAISNLDLRSGITSSIESLEQLVNGSVSMEQLSAAPWVVLSGPTNAGKSALFNALLRRDRSVVADVAGTTRDVLVEPWIIPCADGPREVLLVDAPGKMDAVHAMDELGQRMRGEAMQRATITLQCSTVGERAAGTTVPHILVQTQCDRPESKECVGAVRTSATTGLGIDQLTASVGRMAENLGATTTAEAMCLAERHRVLVHEAIDHLRAASDASLETDGGGRTLHPELVAATLHAALESLGGVAGRLAPDDILGRIFSRFCVGK